MNYKTTANHKQVKMSKNSIIDNQVDSDNNRPAFIYTIDGIVYCTDIDRWERMSENARNKFIAILKIKQQMPLTTEEIEELELLNEKYVVGDKTIENLTIALRIKELTDKCDNTTR